MPVPSELLTSLKDGTYESTELKLSEYSPITNEELQFLVTINWQRLPITSLDTRKCGFNDSALLILADIISNSPITNINLSSNKFTAAGLSAINAWKTSTLQELNLSSCGLRDDSISVITEITKNLNLNALTLSGNTFTTPSIRTLWTSLNPELKEIDLSYCGLKDAALKEIAQNLHNLPIQKLNLNRNRFASSSIKILAEQLKNSSVTDLILWDCNLNDESATALKDIILESNLIHIDLASNTINATLLEEIQQCLQQNRERLERENQEGALAAQAFEDEVPIIIDENTSIQTIAQLLKHQDERIKIDALKTLVDRTYREAITFEVIQKTNLISLLVKLLQDEISDVRENAALALGYLAYENDAIRVAIEKAGAIPFLVKLLQDESSNVRRNAAWVLGNLAIGNIVICEAIEKAGAIPFLIELLCDESLEVRGSAAWALGNLASGRETICEVIEKAGAIPFLVKLLQDESSNVRRNAVWALASLTEDNVVTQKIIRESDAISILEDLAENDIYSDIQFNAHLVLDFCVLEEEQSLQLGETSQKEEEDAEDENSIAHISVDDDDYGDDYFNWLEEEISMQEPKGEKELVEELAILQDQFGKFQQTQTGIETEINTGKSSEVSIDMIHALKEQLRILEERIELQSKIIAEQNEALQKNKTNLTSEEQEILRLRIQKDREEEANLKEQLKIVQNPLYNVYYQAFKQDFAALTIASFAVGKYLNVSNSFAVDVTGFVANVASNVVPFVGAILGPLQSAISFFDKKSREAFLKKIRTFCVTPMEANALFEETARLCLKASAAGFRSLTKEQARLDVQKIIKAIASKSPPQRDPEALVAVVFELPFQKETISSGNEMNRSTKKRYQTDKNSTSQGEVEFLRNKIDRLEQQMSEMSELIQRNKERSAIPTEKSHYHSTQTFAGSLKASNIANKADYQGKYTENDIQSLELFFNGKIKKVIQSVSQKNKSEEYVLLNEVADKDLLSQIDRLITYFSPKEGVSTISPLFTALVESIYKAAHAVQRLHGCLRK